MTWLPDSPGSHFDRAFVVRAANKSDPRKPHITTRRALRSARCHVHQHTFWDHVSYTRLWVQDLHNVRQTISNVEAVHAVYLLRRHTQTNYGQRAAPTDIISTLGVFVFRSCTTSTVRLWHQVTTIKLQDHNKSATLFQLTIACQIKDRKDGVCSFIQYSLR